MNTMLIALGQAMVDAYSWGYAAKNAATPFQTMDEVKAAPGLDGIADLQAGLVQLLGPEGQGVGIFAKADALMDAFPAFDDLREYLIDLCVVRLITELEGVEENEDDAFDSPEWLKIEEATGDRGSEVLNLLIYIKDCKINGADPDLEDFLYEFLLADDEDFQDELAIYEPFVKNLTLIEAPLKTMILAGNNQRDNELRELFTPMMLFFREEEAVPGKLTLALLEYSALPELHCALYRLLCAALTAEL
jgi:hypothetical protein